MITAIIAKLVMTLVTSLGGYVMRAVMQWIDAKKNKDDNAFKLEDKRLDIERLKQEGFDPEKAAAAQVALNSSKMALLNRQMDDDSALAKSVRPAITYLLLTMLLAYKVMLVIMVFRGDVSHDDFMAKIWTEYDSATLGTVIGYWFADRTIKKNQSF